MRLRPIGLTLTFGFVGAGGIGYTLFTSDGS